MAERVGHEARALLRDALSLPLVRSGALNTDDNRLVRQLTDKRGDGAQARQLHDMDDVVGMTQAPERKQCSKLYGRMTGLTDVQSTTAAVEVADAYYWQAAGALEAFAAGIVAQRANRHVVTESEKLARVLLSLGLHASHERWEHKSHYTDS